MSFRHHTTSNNKIILNHVPFHPTPSFLFPSFPTLSVPAIYIYIFFLTNQYFPFYDIFFFIICCFAMVYCIYFSFLNKYIYFTILLMYYFGGSILWKNWRLNNTIQIGGNMSKEKKYFSDNRFITCLKYRYQLVGGWVDEWGLIGIQFDWYYVTLLGDDISFLSYFCNMGYNNM